MRTISLRCNQILNLIVVDKDFVNNYYETPLSTCRIISKKIIPNISGATLNIIEILQRSSEGFQSTDILNKYLKYFVI